MQMPTAVNMLWLLWFALMWPVAVNGNREEYLQELLSTETTLINSLRDYIDSLDQQLELIKMETAAIDKIHQQVGDQVEQYMGNPLNVLTILKRFQSVWPMLEQQANATHKLAETLPDYELELQLPSEEDYEEALLNLLRLQSVYDLEPATLSLGMVNGLKLGSAMSWSDCLDMAVKSNRNGDYAVAKYWLETALGKLPAGNNNATISASEQEQGKVKILEASLTMDYRAGEFLSALTTAKELLQLRPANQKMQKAKAKIEGALNATAKKKLLPKRKQKLTKSVEQQLVDELCRSATQQPTTGSRLAVCRQDNVNLRMLRLEQLSEDPHIILYHNVLSSRQTDELISLLDDDDEQQFQQLKGVAYAPLKFTRLGQKKMHGSISKQLDLGTAKTVELWQARRQSHEHVTMEPEELEQSEELSNTSGGSVARAMLNLQESKLGGALVFPQLELSVNVPRGSLLYWHIRNTNELPATTSRLDYRSRQFVCPVLLGAQLSAWTEFR